MKMNLDRNPETNEWIQTFAIVGCGSQKADEKTAAADLHFKRRWAELYCDNWLILSAEHGLIDPGRRLEPYDTSVRDLDEDALQKWRADVEQELWYRSNSYEGNPAGNDVAWGELDDDFEPNFELMILAGQAYLEPFGDFFEETFPAPVYYPLAGMRIGKQTQWLKAWNEAHPWLDDVTEETAVAVDYAHDNVGDADIYYLRHETGNVMVVPTLDDSEPRIQNDTPEEGLLNSPGTAMENHRCWTVPASEVPAVNDVEWEVEPTLADFAGGASA